MFSLNEITSGNVESSMLLNAKTTGNVQNLFKISMNGSTGCTFKIFPTLGYSFICNGSFTALTMDTGGNCRMPYNLFLTGTSSKLCIGGTSTSYQLEVSATSCQTRLISTGANDCILWMTAGVNGKAQLKATSGGVFYIQSTTSATGQDIQYYVSSSIKVFTMAANGACYYYSTIGAACDSKLKDDQQIIDKKVMVEIFNNIEPKSYIRNDIPEDVANGARKFGFIAQDVEAQITGKADFQSLVMKSTLGKNEDGTDKEVICLNYDGLLTILWGVVKQQQTTISSFQSIIETLEERISLLENKEISKI